jgi:branched-chain amino acid aminotransferase
MWGVPVCERKISIDEVMEAHQKGTLEEVFGSGTAAVISPVGEIKYDEKIVTIGKGEVGSMAKRFFKAITDIQYGRAKAPADWIETL